MDVALFYRHLARHRTYSGVTRNRRVPYSTTVLYELHYTMITRNLRIRYLPYDTQHIRAFLRAMNV